jgi:hypothetical protein
MDTDPSGKALPNPEREIVLGAEIVTLGSRVTVSVLLADASGVLCPIAAVVQLPAAVPETLQRSMSACNTPALVHTEPRGFRFLKLRANRSSPNQPGDMKPTTAAQSNELAPHISPVVSGSCPRSAGSPAAATRQGAVPHWHSCLLYALLRHKTGVLPEYKT